MRNFFFNSDRKILLRLIKTADLLLITFCFVFFIFLLFYLFDSGATMVAKRIVDVSPLAAK